MDVKAVNILDEILEIKEGESEISIENLEERVNDKLKKFGMPELSTLNQDEGNHLLRIERGIIDLENERNSYLCKYKTTKINTKTISERTGISRTTVYKYKEILIPYINNTQDELVKNDSAKVVDEKNEIIKELKEQISKLQSKSLKEQRLMDKIQDQEKEYNNLLKQIKNLEYTNATLNKQIEKLNFPNTQKIVELF